MSDTKFIEAKIHPVFLKFIEVCTHINFGQIECLQIQDGLPVLTETIEEMIRSPEGIIRLPGAKITKKTKLV